MFHSYSHIAAYYYNKAAEGKFGWNISLQFCAMYRNLSKPKTERELLLEHYNNWRKANG